MTLSELYFLKIISCVVHPYTELGLVCVTRESSRSNGVWFPSLGPKTALQLLPWLFEALILWEASHSVGGTTQKAHVKRSTWRALRRATKNWHQLARHVHTPLWKCTFQPYLSLQMICATLEVHLPAPLKPSEDHSPGWQFDCSLVRDSGPE